MDPVNPQRVTPGSDDSTRRAALTVLFAAILAIAVGYAAAFRPGGAPTWAAALLALGIPAAIGGIMVLGAARGRSGVGRLTVPFVFVVVILVLGFGAALLLPSTESAASRLWLGLPARAAIVIYGIGLLPIVVLPLAYALTFDSQTLNADDIEQVRSLAQKRQRFPRDGPANTDPHTPDQ
jgi:hypothetical protein